MIASEITDGRGYTRKDLAAVAEELSWEYSKIKKSEVRSISELRWQKNRTLALEECTARHDKNKRYNLSVHRNIFL